MRIFIFSIFVFFGRSAKMNFHLNRKNNRIYIEPSKNTNEIYNNANMMSLTPDQGKTELNKLIKANRIHHFSNFKALPNDSHMYRYNLSKQLSKILLKKKS